MINTLRKIDMQWYINASESEQELFRDWLKGVLRMYEETQITFTKKNGDQRVMKCTLKETIVPVYVTKTSGERAQSNDTLFVYDLDKSDWRSFRFDSVTQINFDL